MHLVLWRHAEAEDDVPDASRRLTSAGRRDAQRVASWLEAHLPGDARIVVSPAQRALETARALRAEFEVAGALAPGRSVDEMLAVARWPEVAGVVVIVGHQPTLGAAAARLVGGPDEGYRMKPAALWWLVRRGASWAADVRTVIAPESV